jgi:parallel beta-helix repeat protein
LIEIRTQQDFDTIFATGTSMPSNELIRIFPLEGGGEYVTEGLEITKSNVIVEGINKPKIKQSTESTTKDILYIHGTSDTESNVLENIIIRGLHFIGDKDHAGGATGQHGIFIENCGFAQTTGLTTGDYSRYDSTTMGYTKTNKIGVRVDNCVVEDCKQYGVYLNVSKNCKLVNNTVQNNVGDGVHFASAYNNTIIGNIIQYNDGYGGGIYLNTSSNNIITKNTVQNNGTSASGISLSSSSNNTISGNTVQNNSGRGINLISSSNSTITGNTVQNSSSIGVYLQSSASNTITGNTVQNNNSYGIYLNASSNNTVTSNTVQNNNGYGILLQYSTHNNTVSGNTVQNNSNQGIYLYNASKNCITNNIVYQNNNKGIELSGTNSTYNNLYGNISQENTGGNYSSDGGTGNQMWANMNIY